MKKIIHSFLSLLLVATLFFIPEYGGIKTVSAKTSGDYSYEVLDEDTIKIINYVGADKNLVIPSTIDGYNVKKIGYGAFAESKGIETLEIPNTVVGIEDYAFSQCTQIREIKIPDSVVSFGQYVFAGANSLTTVSIPKNIKSIGIGMFFNCKNLVSINIPNGVENIAASAFSGCDSLVNIGFPDTIRILGNNAFSECIQLTKMNLPEGITSIGSNVFSGCISMEEIHLPETLTGIGINAFQDCISLKTINLPESLLAIGAASFSGCSQLKDIILPSKITSLGNAMFSGCNSLESLIIPSNVTELGGYVFSGCTSLKTMVLPDTITSVGDEVFSNCSSLESITLPSKIKTIGINFFRYCDKLKTVIVPESVQQIQPTAFANCANLQSVVLPSNIKLESRVFADSPNVVLLVGENSKGHQYAIQNSINFKLINVGINLTRDTLSIKLNDEFSLIALLSPYTILNNQQLLWSSSDNAIVSVDANGVLHGNKIGVATITAKTTNGLTTSIEIEVHNNELAITSVNVGKTELDLKKGTAQSVLASVSPNDTTMDKTLTYTSLNTEIATVNSMGVVTARKPGNTKILITSSNGLQKTVTVNVTSEISSVFLNLTSIVIDQESSQSLRATINPSDTTYDKSLTWSSSNTNVATVDTIGNVKGIAKGTATITVKTTNGRRAECKVVVNEKQKDVPITSITLDKTTTNLVEGDSDQLRATINPTNTTMDKTLTWKSKDESIASVDATGKITAKKVGTTTIEVSSINGKLASCEVKVIAREVPITSITLDKATTNLVEGDSDQLRATINPTNTTMDKTLTWKSKDESIASVDATGKITAKKVGTTTIEVSSINGKLASCEVKVIAREVPITSITLDKTTTNLVEGDSDQLRATINPTNTTMDKTLTWKSKDESIASVDATGKITAKKVGTTTIEVSSINGKLASCEVKVIAREVPITSITLDKTNLMLRQGREDILKVTINPTNTTDDVTATWSSSDADIVSVDNTGKVIAKKVGTATIKVSIAGKSASCKIEVLEWNTEKLLALIHKVETMDDIYTVSSTNQLTNALSTAKAVLNDESSTQNSIDLASSKLQEAIDHVVVKVKDDTFATLNTLYNEAKNIENDFTESEFKEMKNIIQAIDIMLKNGKDDVAQKDAEQYVNEATIELANLRQIKAQNDLKAVVKKANALLQSSDINQYDAFLIETLKNAVRDGEVLLNNSSKDIDAMKQATQNIQVAFNDVTKQASTNDITILISEVNNLDKELYSTNSWDNLMGKLDEAIHVINNASSNDALNNAYDNLLQAISDLRPPVNKAILQNSLDTLKNISLHKENYVANTIKDISNLLDEAQRLFNDELTSQQEINDMNKKLTTAIFKARKIAD